MAKIDKDKSEKKYYIPYVEKGTKFKYKTSYAYDLVHFMSNGGTFEAFPGEIGVTSDTIDKWLKEYKTFARAYELAKPAFLKYWQNKLRDTNKNDNASVLKHVSMNYIGMKSTDKGVEDNNIKDHPTQIVVQRKNKEVENGKD